MPPRYLSWFIVAFWLGTTGWLFYRDLRPRLFPSGPPPYTIDLTEEAQSNISTAWTIYWNGVDSGYCKTRVVYHAADDTFEPNGEFKLWFGDQTRRRQADVIINSMYRVTREGNLREVGVKLTVNKLPGLPFNAPGLPFEGTFSGKVQGGLFTPTIKAVNPLTRDVFEQELKPARVSETGSVLNPLQPWNRLPGIRKGQRWEIPLVDPLTDVGYKYLKELFGAMSTQQLRVLQAEVLSRTEYLEWKREQPPVECLVIEYTGEDISAKTWVRARDGVVLRQEVKQQRENLVLVRE